jgi:calcineurin-like phosphoesterase family protein
MNKWIISDLHLGHKKILEFEGDRLGVPGVSTAEEHDEQLEMRWNSIVNPKDIVYVLGDVAFTAEALKGFKKWKGRKILVRGNHDDKAEELYRDIFYKIYGVIKINKVWLTHAPIHPAELRGCPNVHGHVHSQIIRNHYHEPDKRYRAVCVEQNEGYPEDFDKVLEEARAVSSVG